MCSVLSVSQSGYHAYCDRSPSPRATSDDELAVKIEKIFYAKRCCYGAVRITNELRTLGDHVAKKRVARLMRELGLHATPPPHRTRTTDSRHSQPIAPNLLKREFSTTAPDRAWVGDITYVWTSEGWLYLAVYLDLFSRKVVGWAMSDCIDQQLTCAALSMALTTRQPDSSLIVHTDRGVQYAANGYRRLLSDWSATASMSRKADCYDNAVAESFFASLKKELIHRSRFRTRDDARTAIFEYIEAFYNRERTHSTLGLLSPTTFEHIWRTTSTKTTEPTTVGNPFPKKGFSIGVGDRFSSAVQYLSRPL